MTVEALFMLAYLLMSITQETLWYCAFSVLFPAKLAPRFYFPLVIVLNTLHFYLAYYPLADHAALRVVLSLSYFAFFLLVLHRGKILRKLLAVLAVFTTMALTEFSTFILSPTLSSYMQHRDLCHLELIPFYFVFLFAQIIFLLLMVCAFRLLDKKNEDRVSDKDRLCYLLLPINQFILLTVWYYSYTFASTEAFTPKKLLIIITVMIFTVLTDIVLLRLISRTAESAELRARNELMEDQIAAKAKYYQLMAESYSNMRQMRHDIANHLCTIHAMLESGEKDEARKYVTELEKTTAVHSLLSDCQDIAVDAFLRERTAELKGQGISLSADIRLPAQCFVSDVDLITALGNLLDNAADACRQVTSPSIKLRAELADGFLHIESKNPYDPGGSKKERRISYMERGTGSIILKSLAEKYSGSYSSHVNDGIYNNILILKESASYD